MIKFKTKVILAINLGTLNNFLEADIEGKFTRFKRYVEKIGILDEMVSRDEDDLYFHSVNFADYHLYEFSSSGVHSKYIKGILKKIVQRVDDNIFYKEYCECYGECNSKEICPIKINYDLLSNDNIQDGIINTLVECIVKNKMITSKIERFILS